MRRDSRLTLALPERASTTRALWALARHVSQRTTEAIRSKYLIKIIKLYGKANVTQIAYGEDGVISSWGATHHFVHKPEWEWMADQPSTRSAIRTEPEFTQCLDMLFQQFPRWSKDGLQYYLQEFTTRIETHVADGADEEALLDTVSIFIADLSNEPCDIRVAARLTGITLPNESPLQIGSFSLRRLAKTDFEWEHALEPVMREILPMTWRITPSAILEFSTTGDSGNPALVELSGFLHCLCLFRLGSVRYVDYEYVMRSIVRPSNVVDSNRSFAPSYRYMLTLDDVPHLTTFVSQLNPLLPKIFDKETKPLPAQIAFIRYTDAILRAETIDSRITSAITCLEALFLRERERSELTHKLSLRCAALMGLLDKDALEVKGHVSRAYDIRSTYIHGGLVDVGKGGQLEELCTSLLEYARLSVQVFLQLQHVAKKDDFIADLDKALLDPGALSKLRHTVGGLLISK